MFRNKRDSQGPRWHRVLLALVGVSVFSTGLAPPSAVAAGDGPVMLVTGAVLPAPLEGNVTVYLWPDSAARAGMEPGAVLNLPVVAQSVFKGGSFAVPMPPDTSAIAAEAASNGGTANFMLTAVGGQRSGNWFFSRSLRPEDAAPVVEVPLDSPAPAPGPGHEDPTDPICGLRDIDPGSGLTERPLTERPSPESAASPENHCVGGTTPSATPCYAELIDSGNWPDTIGEIHVPSGGTGAYTYTQGASTMIEVKVSADGGNWQGGGGVKMVKQSSLDSGWNVGSGFAQQLQTHYRFEKYRLNGYCPPELTIKASGWLGGATHGVGVGQWDGQCLTTYKTWAVPYTPGTWLEKTAGRSFRYAIGATAFGINLGSETEWTTQHKFKIDFSQLATMCGNDAPISGSSLVYKQ